MSTKYTGRCYRHGTRFIPSEEFDNNCPACYWEMEAKKETPSDEPAKRDENIVIRNIGGGVFRRDE